MFETFLPVFFLGVMAACFVAMTLTVVFTARELRHVLRRVNAMLPGATQALHEAHQFLSRTNASMRHVETVVQQLCGAASDLFERWTRLKQHAEALWTMRMGNGTRAEPRLRNRRRQGNRRDG